MSYCQNCADLTAKLQAAEAENKQLLGLAACWQAEAERYQAEVARLTDCLETQYEINRNTARAACEARGDHFDAEDRVAELEAAGRELIRTQDEAIRTATEAALSYSYNELAECRNRFDRKQFVDSGLKALLGEE